MTVPLTQWNRWFSNLLQGKDFPAFLHLLGWFAVLAMGYIIMVVFALTLAQMLQIGGGAGSQDGATSCGDPGLGPIG